MGRHDRLATERLTGDPVPGDPMQGDPMQGDPMQGDPMQGDPVSDDPVSDDTVPVASVPAEPVSAGSLPPGDVPPGSRIRGRRRRARIWPLLLAVLVAVGVVGVTVHHSPPSAAASVAASSSDLAHPAGNLLSAPVDAARPLRWRSAGQTVGASVTTTWSSARTVGRIEAHAPADRTLAIRGAYLTFGDGSSLDVRPDAAGDIVLAFTERSVQWVSLTVTAVSSGSSAVGLSSLSFDDDGGLAPTVEPLLPDLTATSSPGGSDPSALVDGAAGLPADTGAVWTSGPGTDGWVQLTWSSPREVSAVQFYGSPQLPGRVLLGTVEFSDGSAVPVAGVAPGAAAPSTIAFMPRVATSMRFVMHTDGPVALREVAVFQRGQTPPQPAPGPGVTVDPVAAPACAAPPTPNTDTGRLRLLCPQPGSSVGDTVQVVVAAPPSSALTVTAWTAWSGADVDGGDTVIDQSTADADGYAVFTVDCSRLRHGPAVLKVTAGGLDEPLYVQLYNPAGSAERPTASPQSRGMTLGWSDDFRSPLSISRTGQGAVYAATQPSVDGPSEFGDAVFADPAWNTPNIGTVGGDYLRIRASDRPAGVPDPFGYNRRYLGGMLSSAAVGGSGFSAQSGYFEARILGAPGPGTWPAFWALSSRKLVDRAASSGEVDAAEMYGHDTSGACYSVHNWVAADDKQVDCDNDDGLTDWALHWHVYGARVTPDGTVTFSVDGTQVSQMHGLVDADQPFYFLLDLAMGGGWPTDLSATGGVSDMYVDYVRVYT